MQSTERAGTSQYCPERTETSHPMYRGRRVAKLYGAGRLFACGSLSPRICDPARPADGPSSSSLASQATLSAGSVASTSRQSPANTRIIKIPGREGFRPRWPLTHLHPTRRSEPPGGRVAPSREPAHCPENFPAFPASGLCHVSYITIHISSHASSHQHGLYVGAAGWGAVGDTVGSDAVLRRGHRVCNH